MTLNIHLNQNRKKLTTFIVTKNEYITLSKTEIKENFLI